MTLLVAMTLARFNVQVSDNVHLRGQRTRKLLLTQFSLLNAWFATFGLITIGVFWLNESFLEWLLP